MVEDGWIDGNGDTWIDGYFIDHKGNYIPPYADQITHTVLYI